MLNPILTHALFGGEARNTGVDCEVHHPGSQHSRSRLIARRMARVVEPIADYQQYASCWLLPIARSHALLARHGHRIVKRRLAAEIYSASGDLQLFLLQ